MRVFKLDHQSFRYFGGCAINEIALRTLLFGARFLRQWTYLSCFGPVNFEAQLFPAALLMEGSRHAPRT